MNQVQQPRPLATTAQKPTLDRSSRDTSTGLNLEDCLKNMIKFVRRNKLQKFFRKSGNLCDDLSVDDLSDKDLSEKLKDQAKLASELKLDYINRELAMDLAIMSLYNMVVLVGRCRSY